MTNSIIKCAIAIGKEFPDLVDKLTISDFKADVMGFALDDCNMENMEIGLSIEDANGYAFLSKNPAFVKKYLKEYITRKDLLDDALENRYGQMGRNGVEKSVQTFLRNFKI